MPTKQQIRDYACIVIIFFVTTCISTFVFYFYRWLKYFLITYNLYIFECLNNFNSMCITNLDVNLYTNSLYEINTFLHFFFI